FCVVPRVAAVGRDFDPFDPSCSGVRVAGDLCLAVVEVVFGMELRYRVHGSGAVPPLFLPETLLRSFDDLDFVDPLDADLAPMAADDCSHWMTVGFRQGTAVLAVGEKAVPKGFEFRLFVVAIDGAEHDVFALWV